MTDILHTASPNVQILDETFFMPQLNRYRRIWIYLPEKYKTSKKRYPVLYMHDGQNLFDNATSYSGEWEVDETLDSMPNACIVVGIDNGSLLRMNEYNPNDTDLYGKGEGNSYLEFLVKTLKPFIDKSFRTLRSRKYTITAGSSMGGLISFYAGILYPRVFGGIGIFSPSFWIAPQVGDEVKQLVNRGKHSGQRYYFYAGGAENPIMIYDLMPVIELMRKLSGAMVEVVINPEGWHSEACWRREFPAFYSWVNGGGHNSHPVTHPF